MSILALNKGLIPVHLRSQAIAHTAVPKRAAVDMGSVLADFFHLRLHGIHLAEQIAGFQMGVRLIVEGPGAVNLLGSSLHIRERLAVAAFIAQGPEENTAVVLKGIDHIGHSIAALGTPLGIAGRNLLGQTVGLQVILAHNQNADLVAQFIEPAGIGIMAGAHIGDIAALKQLQVGANHTLRHGVAVIRVEIMAVHAADLQRHTVQENERPTLGVRIITDDLHLPKAVLVGAQIHRLPGHQQCGLYRV